VGGGQLPGNLARTIAKSLIQGSDEFQGSQGIPAEFVGSGSERLVCCCGRESQQGQGDVDQTCQAFGQAWPSTPVPVFVPPAVFDVVQAVFHLPMRSYVL
jgi:hypothetical protein